MQKFRRSGSNLQSMSTFASMVRMNQSLTVICVSCCNIDSASAECLAYVLIQNKILKILNMKSNPVGDRGALAMAEMLKKNATLEKLAMTELVNSSIGTESIVTLSNTLQYNQTLRELHLSERHVHKPLVKGIASALYSLKKKRLFFF